MIFQREHIQLILDGKKTQTRRFGSKLNYYVGRKYPVKAEYYDKPACSILIVKAWKEKLGGISPEDCVKEGAENLEAFKHVWLKIHGDWQPHVEVSVYEFELIPDSISKKL